MFIFYVAVKKNQVAGAGALVAFLLLHYFRNFEIKNTDLDFFVLTVHN